MFCPWKRERFTEEWFSFWGAEESERANLLSPPPVSVGSLLEMEKGTKSVFIGPITSLGREEKRSRGKGRQHIWKLEEETERPKEEENGLGRRERKITFVWRAGSQERRASGDMKRGGTVNREEERDRGFFRIGD